VGPRVEAGRFEVAADVGDDGRRVARERDRRVRHHPIDVVDAEADAFEVEGGDGAGERFGFLDQVAERLLLRNPLQDGKEIVDAALGRLAFVGGHVAQL